MPESVTGISIVEIAREGGRESPESLLFYDPEPSGLHTCAVIRQYPGHIETGDFLYLRTRAPETGKRRLNLHLKAYRREP